MVPPLAEGPPEFQQAGADTAPLVPTECFLVDCLPLVVGEYPVVVEGRYEVIPGLAGVSLGGCHIGVTPGEWGHKSVPPAPVCGAPVEEGPEQPWDQAPRNGCRRPQKSTRGGEVMCPRSSGRLSSPHLMLHAAILL